jgi:hypothetical protein
MITIACILTALTVQQPTPTPTPPAVIGRWDITITTSEGRHLPSWLEVQWSGNRTLVGRFVGVVGSSRPIARLEFSHDTLRFAIPPQWEQGNGDLQLEGVFAGDSLAGSVTDPAGNRLPFTAVRAPTLRRMSPPQWNRPVTLFNGTDLTGWQPLGERESAWTVVGGVLTNTKAGANLGTRASFTDFKLHVEFRYPAGGNSGVYLRGRYEVQIEDSPGPEPAIGGLGAVYGFIMPNENAAKRPGEWQAYDITLVGRLLTVVLNGHTIISLQNIPGITGGALDSNEGLPGPIFLQGDHGPIEYRNIVLTPAR